MPADDEAREPGPFHIETIRELVRLMSRNDLNEIYLEHRDSRIRLRRGIQSSAAPVVSAIVPTAMPTPPAPAAVGSVPTPAAPAAPSKALHEIKSPMVGTFYRAEKPDAEPFVKVGTRLTPTTIVGIIEAMKLFNEVPAECSGTVEEVCVDNAQPIEYGTVLFRVNTSA